MNMNNLQVFTKDVLIIVQLGECDIDQLEDFDVVIDAGSINDRRVVHVNMDEKTKQYIKQHGFLKIYNSSLYAFELDALVVTCKYPVEVQCSNFTISKYTDGQQILAKHEQFVANFADQIERAKHSIKHELSHEGSTYLTVPPTACIGCVGSWDIYAIKLAMKAFELAGFDPNKYNFNVSQPRPWDDYKITITIKKEKDPLILL